MRLLIVNDEVIVAKGLMVGLDWSQYGVDDVDVAFEAESARELLLRQSYDIMLCDIEMPGENGIELVHWVREQGMEIEVVFLTCHADFEFAQEAIRLKSQNYILLPASYEAIGDEIRSVVETIEKKREGERQQRYGQLWLTERAQESGQNRTARTPRQSVESACEYIRNNLREADLDLNHIAAALYLNRDYLNRIFKKYQGISIGQYILKERMQIARDMLVEEQFTATQIAEMVGYNSYPTFSVAFKNYYGCSPNTYREKK